MIIRTAKKPLSFALWTTFAFSVLNILLIIDGDWGGIIGLVLIIGLNFYIVLRSFQIAIFRRYEFTLIYCWDRREDIFYKDIEQFLVATIIREDEKPEKWIILRQKDQMKEPLTYQNLESFVKGISIACFPYSKRREKLMDRYFPGKKKYAVLHDKTGVLEEVEPTEMPSAE